jgi:predicted dehydrogenase
MTTSRREFLKTSSTALAGAGRAAVAPTDAEGQEAPAKQVPPSDMLRCGVIGCNGMGWSDMQSLLTLDEVDCVAVCDVDQSVLDEVAGNVEELRGTRPQQYMDYRRLLEDDDIDAVVVGTPDHWHCLITVDALSSGKHVYVEKPLANSVAECDAMRAAAERSGKVVQVGQWQRSGMHYDQALAHLNAGEMGKIRLVKAWSYQGWMKPIPPEPDADAPEGVDYAMWLGPAPARPFNPNRFHFNFRWFWDYAGGLMTDWGVHEIDVVLWAMGATAPRSVMATGGKLGYTAAEDASETPDTLQAIYEYDDFTMLWEHATGIDGGPYDRTEGIAFIGSNGTLVVNRESWWVVPETDWLGDLRIFKSMSLPSQPQRGGYLNVHTKNFVEAIKAGDPSLTHCGIEAGYLAAVNAHLGNIAFKTGRKLYWDEVRGEFSGDDEANAMLAATYHNGWTMPVG